jgi:hypothetical protein
MAPRLYPHFHLFLPSARLNFQPVPRPAWDVQAVGALRHHSLQLLRLECREQIQPALDNVISETDSSGQAPRQDSFQLSFPLKQRDFIQALTIQENEVESKVDDRAIAFMVLELVKALGTLFIERNNLSIDHCSGRLD